ncbi:hypothetical protein COCMIDRAFT_99379, partial [Bipolaris oryzae ATCC 44560]
CFLYALSMVERTVLGLLGGTSKIKCSPCWLSWNGPRGLCRNHTDVRSHPKMSLERPWKAYV